METTLWKPLSERIKGLPLILCGPILRRVEKDSVSVFVAIQKEETVTLEVFNSTYSLMGSSTTKKDGNFLLQIGERLYVTTITVKLPEDNLLEANNLYFYNLSFDSGLMIEDSGTAGEGILEKGNYKFETNDNRNGISYANYKYPSFTLPADNINNLKFIHGSCRKPHGGGKDALAALDVLLNESCEKVEVIKDKEKRKLSLKKRPQFACFTGDQIYADDVADSLLFFLIDAKDTFIKSENLPVNTTAAETAPGNRQKLIAPRKNQASHGKFSSSAAKNHLLYLGEFYAMYLFIWSDVLWPEMPINDDQNDYFQEIGTEIEKKGGRNPYNKPEGEHVPRDFPQIPSSELRLFDFHSSLKNIRRALANLPSYMVFDDHDVTDDWFLTKKWAEYSLEENSLSKRVIHNALSAYLIFQAWGNTPELFEDGTTGYERLQTLKRRGDTVNFKYDDGNQLLPKLEGNKLIGGFDWSFRIHSNVAFDLIFLDTRTKREWINRGFPERIADPALIQKDDLKNQLPEKKKPLTIVVSAAPIFGNFVIENIQDFVSSGFKNTMSQKVDREAWAFDRIAYEDLLLELSKYKRTLILSGDVHYAFSAQVDYWNVRGGDKNIEYASFAQLCSSSLKNSNFDAKVPSFFLLNPLSYSVAGLTFEKGKYFEKFKVVKDENNNAKHTGNVFRSKPVCEYHFTVKDPWHLRIRGEMELKPDWEYTVTYIRGEGKNSIVDLKSNKINELAGIHKKLMEYHFDKEVIGKSNIGVVDFKWDKDIYKVEHTLWSINSSSKKELKSTHVLSLKGPDSIMKRPSN